MTKMTAGLAAVAVGIAVIATSVFWAGSEQPHGPHAMAISDAYLRSSTPSSPTAAAFFVLHNATGRDDRLIGAASDVAARVELHSHSEDANGVMRMGEIEGGVVIPAGETHIFGRGGDHVMFMGLNGPLKQGAEVAVTLTFEKAGDVVVKMPVDHDR